MCTGTAAEGEATRLGREVVMDATGVALAVIGVAVLCWLLAPQRRQRDAGQSTLGDAGGR